MVPIIKKTNPDHKNNNIEHLIQKHSQFYAKLEYVKTTDFILVDHKDKKLKKSIRDMIMKLKSLDGRNTTLFWSVDEDRDGTFLTFPSFVAEQARNVISQLPSLLFWIYKVDVLPMLSAAAQRRAREAPWDPKRMYAVSKEDERLEVLIIATKTADDDDTSDFDSDEDSIDTTAELDGDIGREVDEYLFGRASSNESVTTLDTRMAKTVRNSVSAVHEIEASPTKKQKATHSVADDADDALMEDTTLFNGENDTMHDRNTTSSQNSGVVVDNDPLQHMPSPPGPLEGLGDGL